MHKTPTIENHSDRIGGAHTMPAMSGPRPVRAPRGTTLTCRSWPTEAALRMLMNNLDPEVAERPDDLVVYGGTGRAARSWDAFDAICAALTTLADDETLLVQSGKPVGVFTTHAWAPRVLIANSNLVPEWANWAEFRRLEALGLTMYGQMTAGSWIYIGTQGILQGTYECFAEIARRRFGGSLAGTITLTAGLGGMGGAQPLAVTLNGGVALCIDVDARAHPSTARDPLPRRGGRLGRRRGRAVASTPATAARRARWASWATPPPCVPALLERGFPADIVTDQTSAHDPLSYMPLDLTPAAAAEMAATDPDELVRRARRLDGRPLRGVGRIRRHAAPRCSTTATACAPRPSSAASTAPSTTPASCRRTSDRCSARARGRSDGWRCRATPPTSRSPTAPCSRSFPTMTHLRRWIDLAGERVAFQGLPARICWLGYGERHRLGLRFNELVRTGAVSAPIVIGRDHLDSGSVASPYRETEAMADGSDAIADWPLLNALVNTASGATWVSIHHGGGVGIGRSIHAGMVAVADGTELAAHKLERVLTSDPGMGVIRHADAGYDRAREVARRARRAHPDGRRAVTVPIDAGTVADFRRDGAVCVRQAFSPQMVALATDAIEANLAALSPNAKRASGDDDGAFIEDFCNWQRIEPMRRFIEQSPAAVIAGRADGHRTSCGCTTTTSS